LVRFAELFQDDLILWRAYSRTLQSARYHELYASLLASLEEAMVAHAV
jgi:hypothetical protein